VYGIPEDGTTLQRLNCKLCVVHMTRRINRLKYHLAKILGHDVGICLKCTPEIMRVAHDSIQAQGKKKEDAATKNVELIVRSSGVSTPEGSGRGSTNSATGRSTYFFVP
jgi:hypothetical protein